MEFARIGKNTIRCVVTEDEIIEMGYSIEEILGNSDRTQAFMNDIFDLAEQEFQTKFDLGLKTVRADFLPDHTVALTFSESAAQESINGLVERLLEYVNQMIEGSKQKQLEEASRPIVVLFQFDSMDVLCRFAKNMQLKEIPKNALYKYHECYYLMMDLSDKTEDEVLRLSALTDEYASNLLVGADRLAFMKEHADVIMQKEAIESLRQI